jgi:hypothetical protein
VNDVIELDEAAERVRARLEAEGAPLPLEFVRDVVYQFVVTAAQDPASALQEGRDTAVRRVAAALFEDEAVVGQIVEAFSRDREAHPPPRTDPPAYGYLPPAAQDVVDSDAATIATRLNDAGFAIEADLVERVMANLLALVLSSDRMLNHRATHPAVARRIASALGENELPVRRVVAEIVRLLGDPGRFDPIAGGERSARPEPRATSAERRGAQPRRRKRPPPRR